MGKMFIVIAQTETGDKAVEKHWKDSQKMRMHERLVMKATGYTHRLVSRKPWSVSLAISNKEINEPEFQSLALKQIHSALGENGAQPGDYRVEVQDV